VTTLGPASAKPLACSSASRHSIRKLVSVFMI
jgi:hypothetical protein